MGQILSDEFDDGEPVDSADDTKRVATLSWLDFVKYLNELNEKCEKMIDEQGRHLVFAVKKGTVDTPYLWKATARIFCVKYNTITQEPESYKSMTLAKFLRVKSTLGSILSGLDSAAAGNECVEAVDAVAATTSADGACRSAPKRDMNMSLLLERFDALESPIRDDVSSSECIVCMERRPDVVLPCSHAYCLPCIEQWNDNNHDCPTCRADIESTDDAWVISDYPDKKEFMRYLLQLSE